MAPVSPRRKREGSGVTCGDADGTVPPSRTLCGDCVSACVPHSVLRSRDLATSAALWWWSASRAETCGAPLPFKGAANFAGNVPDAEASLCYPP